ncbi:MAG TPA: methyltransferase domain-containing protein [Streptosporangiaceae bacterium]|nr:methyltransferase domain-containing protein [Streptosporangiaceae bacterium]
MRMADGWDREAGNWARFARAPGLDRAHENVNLPVLRELLPAPARAAGPPGDRHRRLARDGGPGPRPRRPGAGPARGRTALPFPDQAFDLVVAYMCLHDADDLAGATAEIGRVLTRGGRLCAAIVHPLNPAGLLTEAVREARVSAATAGGDPAQLRWARVPLFLHLRAVRP